MNKKTIIVGVLAVIILVAGVGVWKWQENEVKKQAQMRIQNEQLNKIEKKEAQEPQQNINGQVVWYKVPELGIKFPVNDNVKKDLIYNYTESENYKIKSTSFSLKSITNNGENCSAENGPLGNLAKVNGQFKQEDSSYGCLGGFLAKQLDGYFLCFFGPQADDGCFKNGFDINEYIQFSEIEKI